MNLNVRSPVSNGLHIPVDLGVAESTVEQFKKEWNTIDGVNAQMKKWGVQDLQEPSIEYQTVTPELLLSADIRSFTTLFASQLAWYNYATRLLAKVRSALLQVENTMKDVSVSIKKDIREKNRVLHKDDRIAANAMDDVVEADPSHRALKIELQALEQYKLQLSAWMEGLERSLGTVSRQIENRRTENEGGKRVANMPPDAAGRWRPHP